MKKPNYTEPSGIPVSISLDQEIFQENFSSSTTINKKRIFFISLLAVAIALCISFIARLLIYLINLFTNISFHHSFSFSASSPANNNYGLWVIIIPAIGGVIVGLMALYG